MANDTQPAAAPSAAPAAADSPSGPRGASVTEQQVREAMAAAFEVLNGAGSPRILELADKLVLAKIVLRDIVGGSLAIVSRPAPPPAPVANVNRHERRSAKHRKKA